jgi:RHS repeat-associated protein
MRTTNAISALNMTDLNNNGLFDIIVATTHGVRIYNAEDYMDYVMSCLIDYNLDLHYFGARYYTADFPRFISPDPVSGRLTNPISWNRYLYCANDPINYFDPDGRLQRRRFWFGYRFKRSGVYHRIHPGGKGEFAYTVQVGNLFANDATPIVASRIRRKDRPAGNIYIRGTETFVGRNTTRSNPMYTNCHGTTFADGRFWINDDQVQPILDGDSYSVVDGASQAGDVVIWRNQSDNEIVHSARVYEVDDAGNIINVIHLAGGQTESKRPVNRILWC